MWNWVRPSIAMSFLLLSILGQASARTSTPVPQPVQKPAVAANPAQQHKSTENRELPPAANPAEHGTPPDQTSGHPAPAKPGESEQTSSFLPAGDWLVAAATGILALTTLLLWRATADLVRSSERTAERQLRAYLQVTRAVLSWTDKPAVHVEVRNSGATPAYGIVLQVSIAIDDRPLRNEPGLPGEAPSARANIGGGESFNIEVLHPAARWSDGDVKQIESATKALYVFGQITYSDIFGTERFTRLRYMFTGPFPSDDTVVDMQVCDDGNETSESKATLVKRVRQP